MKGFLRELSGLGVSIAEFERIATVSFPTLKKMNEGFPVRASTEARVIRALNAIKAELASTPVLVKRNVR